MAQLMSTRPAPYGACRLDVGAGWRRRACEPQRRRRRRDARGTAWSNRARRCSPSLPWGDATPTRACGQWTYVPSIWSVLLPVPCLSR